MFWDTSALLKLYVSEPDSEELRRVAGSSGEALTISAITLIEAFCAFRRKERAGDLRAGWAERLIADLDTDCRRGDIEVIPISEEIIRGARQAIGRAARTSAVLRSLDAIQVASAVVSGSGVIVSTDVRLREAGLRAGLKLIPR